MIVRWFPRFRRRLGLVVIVLLILTTRLYIIPSGSKTSLQRRETPLDQPFNIGCRDVSLFPAERANATLLMLARNSDLEGAKNAINSVERRFNQLANYPLVVLNDENFTDDFQQAIRSVASGDVEFAVIPKHMWGFPSGTDQTAAETAMQQQADNGILYANHSSYHHMCRFNSGFFFDVEALQKYRWYWRIEPNIEFTCDITYDPFLEMQTRGKKYGYVIALWELKKTIPSLFWKISAYKRAHRIRTTKLWEQLLERTPFRLLIWPFARFMRLRDSEGHRWTTCHFWSNFEIADMDWYRTKEYRDLFAYLDKDGGFYMERWGDAPVHTFAAALLLEDHELHHFQDWGYIHPPFQYIPTTPVGQSPSSPMWYLQSQSVEEWSQHSRLIGCNCDVDMDKAVVIPPTCLNQVMEGFVSE